MSESFAKKLDQIDAQHAAEQRRELELQQERERQELASREARRQAIKKARRAADQFTERVLIPRFRQMLAKLPHAIGERLENDDSVGYRIRVRHDEHIDITAHFGEGCIYLTAEASCAGGRVVYNERSADFPVATFDESAAENWVEEHAIKAYEAFRRHSEAVRNSPPRVI